MLVCPSCKDPLLKKKGKFPHFVCTNNKCSFSKKKFPLINNIPLLIPFGLQDCIFKDLDKNKFYNLGSKKREISRNPIIFKSSIKNFLIGKNYHTEKNFKYLVENLKSKSKILIIGGGEIGSGSEKFYDECKRLSISINSVDVYYSSKITAIADANYLPYESNKFDLVIIQAVLEHVINPKRVVDEIYRVLKVNGMVYAETPFIQSVHEGPYDFTRFTHSGHRWLFKKFEEKTSGVVHGAFTASLFILSYSIAGLLRVNLLGTILRILFSRFCKILDRLNNHKSNIDNACGLYFLGTKSESYHNNGFDINIRDYYRGAQPK